MGAVENLCTPLRTSAQRSALSLKLTSYTSRQRLDRIHTCRLASPLRQYCQLYLYSNQTQNRHKMPGLWRTRLASFLAGSGVTALLAFGVLREDLARQFGSLEKQARHHSSCASQVLAPARQPMCTQSQLRRSLPGHTTRSRLVASPRPRTCRMRRAQHSACSSAGCPATSRCTPARRRARAWSSA